MNTIIRTLTIVSLLVLTACKKEYDAPPVPTLPTGSVVTIADLRSLYTGTPVRFTEDKSVFAVVTADELSGNLYKNVYVQDQTGALNIRLMNSGGLYEGDSIRIYLPGTVLSSYNGMLQLDSVDVDNNVVKQAVGVNVTPQMVTIDQIDASMQAKLVRIDNVQFVAADTAATWADAINQFSQNRILADCNGNQVIVRTSGYASFAGSPVPNGNGSIIAVVGQFNSDMQLYIRRTSEAVLNGARCAEPYLFKDFEDNNITSGGWSIKNVIGSVNWTTNSQGAVYGSYYGQISNYSGSNVACETWYISPAVDLSGSTTPVFTFENACNYNGAAIEVYVSTNYDGISAPSTASWTLVPTTLSTGSWSWVNSGQIPMTAYKVAGVHVAFKYTGTNSDGKTWEIDNVTIEEL